MSKTVNIGDRAVGAGAPTYVIAEIGINHNGDLDLARQMIDAAAAAGCDAVKFQKRTPELCVPVDQRDILNPTPREPVQHVWVKATGPLPDSIALQQVVLKALPVATTSVRLPPSPLDSSR